MHWRQASLWRKIFSYGEYHIATNIHMAEIILPWRILSKGSRAYGGNYWHMAIFRRQIGDHNFAGSPLYGGDKGLTARILPGISLLGDSRHLPVEPSQHGNSPSNVYPQGFAPWRDLPANLPRDINRERVCAGSHAAKKMLA
jgi:hypothetical protein